MEFVDIGVNLTSKRFDRDRDQVLERARQAGVTRMVLTGTSVASSIEALGFARDRDGLFATCGCHPHEASDFGHNDITAIETLAREDRMVAIGECGLDFNRNFSPPEIQIAVFDQHLQLASRLQLPLFIHERDAAQTMVSMLRDNQQALPNAVIHCFTGSLDELEIYVAMGLYIGITGWICDERRGLHLREAVRRIPLDRLLLETDAPWLTPRDLKPKPKDGRNEPAFLPHIAQEIANCRGETLTELAAATTANARTFFGLDEARS